MVEKRIFGTRSDGTCVDCVTVTNNFGEFVELLNYGATIYRVCVLDRKGVIGDVVRGARDLDSFSSGFNGSVIGRCANRIANGRFSVDGKEIQLECNAGGHFLHGASGNYAFQLFNTEIDNGGNRVTFTYTDKGAGGFGCEVEVRVTYVFDDFHCLHIVYEMSPDGITVLCPTNHAFFCLSEYGEVSDDTLQLNADFMAVKGESKMPEGGVIFVKDSPFDFRERRRISDCLNQMNIGAMRTSVDETFLLRSDNWKPVASVQSEDSGRIMNVYTDMPAMVLFVPYEAQPKIGKDEVSYSGYFAICLETQFVPNAVNCPEFQSPIYREGERLVSETVYEFLTNDCG